MGCGLSAWQGGVEWEAREIEYGAQRGGVGRRRSRDVLTERIRS